MYTDFSTVELVIEAGTKEQAMRIAFADIKAEDVALSAVFEEGCNISLPCGPVGVYCIPKDSTNLAIEWCSQYPITDYSHEECNQRDIDSNYFWLPDMISTFTDIRGRTYPTFK